MNRHAFGVPLSTLALWTRSTINQPSKEAALPLCNRLCCVIGTISIVNVSVFPTLHAPWLVFPTSLSLFNQSTASTTKRNTFYYVTVTFDICDPLLRIWPRLSWTSTPHNLVRRPCSSKVIGRIQRHTQRSYCSTWTTKVVCKDYTMMMIMITGINDNHVTCLDQSQDYQWNVDKITSKLSCYLLLSCERVDANNECNLLPWCVTISRCSSCTWADVVLIFWQSSNLSSCMVHTPI